MGTTSIQDRTAEFRAVLAQAQKRKPLSKGGASRQSLLTESQRKLTNGSSNEEVQGARKGARSEFASKAAEIGRGITGTMEKLGRLAERTFSSMSYAGPAIVMGNGSLNRMSGNTSDRVFRGF